MTYTYNFALLIAVCFAIVFLLAWFWPGTSGPYDDDMGDDQDDHVIPKSPAMPGKTLSRTRIGEDDE